MNMQLKKNSSNIKLLFGIILIYYFFIIYFSNQFIYTNDFYTQVLSNQIASDRVEQLLSQQKKWSLIGYLFFTVFFYLKIFLPTLCIFTLCYLSNIKITWKEVFKVALVAEIVFLIYSLYRFGYFLLRPPQSLDDASNFAPLSLYQLFGSASPKYLQYPLQNINVFEIAYWIVLSKGLQQYN